MWTESINVIVALDCRLIDSRYYSLRFPYNDNSILLVNNRWYFKSYES